MLLEDKVVVVTGAGRGVGRGFAEAVVAEGARVAVSDLDQAAVRETATALGDRDRALPLVLDVTRIESIEGAIDATVTTWGRIDGWVNNAGALRMASALETTPADWDLQFDVNVKGLFECSRLAALRMIEQGEGGAIVNIASNAGKAGFPNLVAYNASKAAVISITRSLAAEWAEHGINVNAVCPGGVETPMLRECARWIVERDGGDVDELLATMVPAQLGRHIRPGEVGRLVAFLLSERALLIRGQSISSDGGDTPY
jgi:meso-butanediol dehydrogenase/(S,S)-butanediol dehydrogenase/diacetyl reductase